MQAMFTNSFLVTNGLEGLGRGQCFLKCRKIFKIM